MRKCLDVSLRLIAERHAARLRELERVRRVVQAVAIGPTGRVAHVLHEPELPRFVDSPCPERGVVSTKPGQLRWLALA